MRTLPFALLLTTALSSCTGSGQGAEPVSRKHPKNPDIRLNPNPVRAHRVTLTLKDAPGPFQKVEGFSHYAGHYADRPGVSCGYTAWGVGEISLQKSTEFELKRSSENVYEGIAYADLVQDEDYGKGLCRWSLNGVSARIRANDNLTDARFSSYVAVEQKPVESSKTYYFWKGRYPRADMDGFIAPGYLDKTIVKNELHDELFTMTISTKEMP